MREDKLTIIDRFDGRTLSANNIDQIADEITKDHGVVLIGYDKYETVQNVTRFLNDAGLSVCKACDSVYMNVNGDIDDICDLCCMLTYNDEQDFSFLYSDGF